MEVIFSGIQNFMLFLGNNWVAIIAAIVAALAIFNEVRKYVNKSKEEKIEIAKAQIKEIILLLVTQAEVDYTEWVKAGEVKRAQVIEEIFLMYPILSKIANQEEIIAFIDEAIDEALKIMREIFEQQLNKDK